MTQNQAFFLSLTSLVNGQRKQAIEQLKEGKVDALTLQEMVKYEIQETLNDGGCFEDIEIFTKYISIANEL